MDLVGHDYPYCLCKSEIAAMQWLEATVRPHEMALSSHTIGQYIPALTGAHAFPVHWAATLDFHGKSAIVGEFCAQSTGDVRRREILGRYGVDYVFWSRAQRSLGSFAPGESELFRCVLSSGSVQIYEVR